MCDVQTTCRLKCIKFAQIQNVKATRANKIPMAMGPLNDPQPIAQALAHWRCYAEDSSKIKPVKIRIL